MSAGPGRDFASAVAFLTVLPVPRDAAVSELRYAAPWFPAVGWIVGGLLALAATAVSPLPAGIGGGVVLAAWLAITGMLHLDGLLDSADGLLPPVSTERRLAILKDVQIGAFGFAVGVVFLLLKWQALVALPSAWTLVAVAAWARFVVLLPLRAYPTARPGGLGAAARGAPLTVPLLCALPAVLIAPVPALLMVGAALLTARWAAKRLGGGLTGDVYGAIVEIVELVGLIAAVALAT